MRRAFLGFLCVLSLLAVNCHKREELPSLGKVASFQLLDQTSQPFGDRDLDGKVWVSAFMFTRCPTICPRITRLMQDVQKAAKTQGVPLELVSFSVDPDYDTPSVLSAYAGRYQADPATWHFITGDIDAIKKTAVDSFKLALEGKADAGAEHFGIVHGSHLVLVDQKRNIRGFYRSSDADTATRLVADAKRLSSE